MIDRRTLARRFANRESCRSRVAGCRAWIWATVIPLLALPLTSGREAVAQEMVSITGRVVDGITGDPIPGVAVTVASRGLSVQPGFQLETDSEGEFTVPSIAVGEYRLELSHPRYNPAVGDFTVMRTGGFETSMQPVGHSDGELVTGIVGVLTDESDALLGGVTVRAGQGQIGTFTDARGEFLLDRLIPGQHVIEFSMIGYAPRADTIRVTAGRVTNVRVSLSVDPVALDPIEVSVERREVRLQNVDFYHRRHMGFGRFIDRQDIENRGPAEMTDLFTGIPGVEIYPDPFNGIEKYVVLRIGRLRIPTGPRSDGLPGYHRCFPRVYVDGVLTANGGSEPAHLDSFLNTNAIAGIEIYHTEAGLPPQFAGGSFCGVIAVWTRITGSAGQPGRGR